MDLDKYDHLFKWKEFKMTYENRDELTSGTVIKDKIGNIHLLSEMNLMFGTCDCCVDLHMNDVRYIAHIEDIIEVKK